MLSYLALFLILQNASYFTNAATVYLCGDSTMAKGGQGIEGWGEHLGTFLTIPVQNKAIGGRSVRGFTNEGRFDAVAKVVQPGDTVVIEFGRNDGGTLKNDSRGQVPCPGDGTQTCEGKYKDQPVTVYTFPGYLARAGKAMTSKGAKVIFSAMLPHNIFWTSKPGAEPNLNPTPPKFVEYAKNAVLMVGPGASYVDHWDSTVKMYRELGKEKTYALFAKEADPIHTNAIGAKKTAESFVRAVLEAQDPLKGYVKKS
ncbi:SGNH hydrolase [Microthyrium microscopicum]|uniref:SGNH hydrolase n=1 Tax=Microthyrium microscopicum TaxID=703497 RepID=A0A6A6U7M5_9PEZI|nr:SGNH hydrolase [Microthyrium microscopicum]